MKIIEDIVRAHWGRTAHVHETILSAREAIRPHLEPDSPAWLREAFDLLHAAHHAMGGDPFHMHINAAISVVNERLEEAAEGPVGSARDLAKAVLGLNQSDAAA